jgi:hypothetical protein
MELGCKRIKFACNFLNSKHGSFDPRRRRHDTRRVARYVLHALNPAIGTHFTRIELPARRTISDTCTTHKDRRGRRKGIRTLHCIRYLQWPDTQLETDKPHAEIPRSEFLLTCT